jgi:nucleotide-binding universal stress UspA family protein
MLIKEPLMPLKINNICVPTDFSDCAEEAVHYGSTLAKEYNAKLHLVHVMHDFHEKFQHPDFTQDDSSVKAFFKAMEHGASENLARLAAKKARNENDVVKVYLYGEVADAVLRYVEKNLIDLIIIGHHGRSGAKRPVLGANAQRILRDSPVPVLTVPFPQSRSMIVSDEKLPGSE